MKIQIDRIALIILPILLLTVCSRNPIENKNDNPYTGDPNTFLQMFEERLENVRIVLKIPGISASIVKDKRIVWAKGFGYANVENDIAATTNTQFRLASVTKTYASTIIMQLVEEGLVSLEDPVSAFEINLTASDTIRIKHLLTHTSEGNPGTSFNYNGDRYNELTKVIEKVTDKTFAEVLAERIVLPLGLVKTGPSNLNPAFFQITGIDAAQFILDLAQGYSSDGTSRLDYPSGFGASAGLISTVLEVAKYSIAIDNNVFFSEETKALVFTPAVNNNGENLPYGLGWFIQYINGEKIVWHHGHWQAISSLFIKVQEKELAFIILANSDMVNGLSSLSSGNLKLSNIALEFLNAFVFGDGVLPDSEYINPE